MTLIHITARTLVVLVAGVFLHINVVKVETALRLARWGRS